VDTNELLAFYGQPVDGTLATKRRRLARVIGQATE
jgi:hypothetical protein